MNCIQKNCFFYKQEGNVQSINYEFVCKYSTDIEKDNASFFVYDLNQMAKDCSEMSEEQVNLQMNSYIVGFVYCSVNKIAVNLSSQFISYFKSNIYFQQGQFEEAFQNSIQAFKDISNSFEIQSQTLDKKIDMNSMQLAINNKDKSIGSNFMLKLKNKIYFSKPSGKLDNIWGIKMKEEDQLKQLQKEQLTQVSDNMYLLELDSVKDIDEVVISDHLNTWQKVSIRYIATNHPKRESIFSHSRMHYLRIKNMHS